MGGSLELNAAGGEASPEGTSLEAAVQRGSNDVGGCRKYSGRNCYGNGNNYEPCRGQNGGYSNAADEYSYRKTSLWECTHICITDLQENGDRNCHAVVYLPSQGKCYFRTHVNID